MEKGIVKTRARLLLSIELPSPLLPDLLTRLAPAPRSTYQARPCYFGKFPRNVIWTEVVGIDPSLILLHGGHRQLL
ncbi:hypothetical protein CDL15_Pgr004627 [Punica granatum]|uniref:Uncharacterized protein n=1 Tax=Punica granatum TaxID=22663 RepID=A0A218WR72_PUNGR|nr:hypothetical protein CDL15_Pgr004627 [Punica granatum]